MSDYDYSFPVQQLIEETREQTYATHNLVEQQRVANLLTWYGESKMPPHLEAFCIRTLGLETP